ncbi:MAG: hypothetical protein AMK71_03135 [Nitrospira bacterium SG8_35_4]|nr:MAG: hypothetical protein AMK71_03135 [Nitrospira bacterium SG8_35_4]
MIWFTVSFISGIAAFKFIPYFPLSILACCIMTVSVLFSRHKKNRNHVLFIVMAFLAGFIYSSVRHSDIPELSFPSEVLQVAGNISDIPEITDEKVRFTIDEVSVNGQVISGKVRLTLYQNNFLISLSEIALSPGNRIIASAKLRIPAGFRNPGVHSYDLREQGIVATGFVKSIKIINGSGLPQNRILMLRQRLAAIIENSLSKESASLHKAIIPGLKGGIRQEIREAFSASGLAHLLSISGTHFGLLAFIFFQSIRNVTKYLPQKILTRLTLYITPTQIAILCTLPVLGAYAHISGMSTPTVRSLIMVFIYMLALFVGRRGEWMNSLSIAAIIILVCKPAALFELSFTLSFLAVFSIGSILEHRSQTTEHRQQTRDNAHGSRLEKAGVFIYPGIMKKLMGKIQTGFLLTTAAVFGTAPLSIAVFHQLPVIAPLANLIVTPLVCFIVLPMGFVTGFAALLFDMQTMPFNTITDAVSGFSLLLVQLFSNIPSSNIRLHTPSAVLVAAYYISLIPLFQNKSGWRAVPVALVVLLYIMTPYFPGHDFRITFLDVGQGDSSVVEFPDRTVMLIDGGSEDAGAGQRAVAPSLWSRGTRTIDYLVVSHPHPDHYSGLSYILDNFEVGEVWATGKSASTARDFFQSAAAKGITVRTLVRGDFMSTKDYRVYVLHPYEAFYAGSPRGDFSDENSHSLVLKIESAGTSILFTGDMEEEAEENMLELGKWLTSDIIKVPHHGARTSSSIELIRTVNPDVAVISVGKQNPFHHPHHKTLERYKGEGVTLFRTDLDGAVTITGRNDFYEIRPYKDSRFQTVTSLRDEIRNLGLLFY